MDYEQRYKEALDEAKAIHKAIKQDLKPLIEQIFPELKESDDERIRKAIICGMNALKKGNRIYFADIYIDDILAWLEKQGEQKSANKVEPKFKEGDWVVFNGLTLYINEVVKGYYRTISKSGTPNSYDWNIDNAARLWTIKDAKDGDVLANDKSVFIYAKVLYNKPYAYCGVDKFGVFKDDCLKYDWSNSVDNIHPATKEQRETLFEKMKLEGYRWDEDEKKVIRFERFVRREESDFAFKEDENGVIKFVHKES